MSFGVGEAVAGGALLSSLFMPKPQAPAMNISVPRPPTVVVPDQPTTAPSSPANPPLAPNSMSDTAALRRARANRSINTGPSQLILSRGRGSQDTAAPSPGGGSGGGLVTRTSILGR